MILRPLTPAPKPKFKPPDNTCIRLGTDNDGNLLELTDKQRCQHTYIIGVSGAGKTMLTCGMALQDLFRDATVIYLDPIGTAVPYLMDCLGAANLSAIRYEHTPYPALNRMRREQREAAMSERLTVIRFDRPDFSARFNPIQAVPWMSTAEQAEAFAAVIERIVGGKMSEMRALHMLLVGLASVLIDTGGATIRDMADLLMMDTRRLRTFLRHAERCHAKGRTGVRIRPDLARLYLGEWFAHTSGKERRDAAASTFRALGMLLADPIAARFLSSPVGNVDLSATMNGGKSLLVCMPPDNLLSQAAIGGLLLTWVDAMAMRRSSRDVIEGRVPQVHLYIDEFHRLFTTELAQDTAVLRNKGVSLTLAHQSSNAPEFSSLETRAMLESIRDNASTHIVMRVGRLDGQDLAGSVFEPRGLMEKLRREDVAYSTGTSNTDSTQTSTTTTRGTSHTDSHGQSWTNSHTQSNGTSWSASIGESFGYSEGHTVTDSRGHSSSQSTSSGESETTGRSHTLGGSWGTSQSVGYGEGRSQSHGEGQSWSSHQSEGFVLGLELGQVAPTMMVARESLARSSGRTQGGSTNYSESDSSSRSSARSQSAGQSESHGASSNRGYSKTTGRSEGTSESHGRSKSESMNYGQSRTQTKGGSSSVAVGTTTGTNVGSSDTASESRSEGWSQGHTTGRTTGETRREIVEHYSVQEEIIVCGYELQALPNRTAVIVQRGGGELRRTVITTIDMPQSVRTTLGPLDALADLERIIAPEAPEPEPTLGILERLRARLGYPGTLEDDEEEE